jgi:GT2 family glycosyltransferase
MKFTLPQVAVIIVGYRNSHDIADCITALSRALPEPEFDVFICENGGREAYQKLIADLSYPQGPCTIGPLDPSAPLIPPTDLLAETRFLFVKQRSSRVWAACAVRNLGYAGAINAWIKRLQHIPSWDGVWILNPDTVPDPDALAALAAYAKTGNKGMIGSTILPYPNRSRIHCRGGLHWSKFTARTVIVGYNDPLDSTPDVADVEARMDGPSGTSIYVTRACIDRIGLMDERFFLYYEDLDWGMRAKRCGLLGYANASIVQHKGGTTIGSAKTRSDRSPLSVYLENRNRLHFVRIHCPGCLAWISTLSFAYALEYLIVRSPGNFFAAIQGVLAGLKKETGASRLYGELQRRQASR